MGLLPVIHLGIFLFTVNHNIKTILGNSFSNHGLLIVDRCDGFYRDLVS